MHDAVAFDLEQPDDGAQSDHDEEKEIDEGDEGAVADESPDHQLTQGEGEEMQVLQPVQYEADSYELAAHPGAAAYPPQDQAGADEGETCCERTNPEADENAHQARAWIAQIKPW